MSSRGREFESRRPLQVRANAGDPRASEVSKDGLAALSILSLGDQRVGVDVLEARESRLDISWLGSIAGLENKLNGNSTVLVRSVASNIVIDPRSLWMAPASSRFTALGCRSLWLDRSVIRSSSRRG